MRIDFSEILRKFEGKANAIHINNESLMDLLNKAKKKVQESEQLNKFWDEIKLLMDLLKDWSRGDYKDVSKNNVIMITVGLLYLVSPIDILPDFLPGGFIDDLAVIAFIVKKTSDELKKYKEWRGIIEKDNISEEEESDEDIITIIEESDEEENSNIIIIGGVDEED